MKNSPGDPSPFRFLEAGERLHYFDNGEARVFVVPPTLRIDAVGKAAAQKHMKAGRFFIDTP